MASDLIRAIIIVVALALAGCSTIQIVQEPELARVRVGAEDAYAVPAKAAAPFVVGYALLAQAAYDDALYDPSRAKRRKMRASIPGEDVEASAFERRALPWIAPWVLAASFINHCDGAPGPRRDFGYGRRPGSCAESDSPSGRILDGLGLQIWTHGSPGGRFCREIVLSFRGTDRAQSDDWLSNFRSVTRVMHLYDQYEQVQAHIRGIVDKVRRFSCYREGLTTIQATGHSLGGGLAQQAAYADGRIRRVFAFDPSFVTGYYDLERPLREMNSAGLKIERIYEHGEILAYARLLLRNIYPPEACDPQIRHIRFNLIPGGSVVEQHSLKALTSKLLLLAEGTAGRRTDDSFLPVSPLSIAGTGRCRASDKVASTVGQ